MNYCKIILWREHTVTLKRLLSNMTGSRQFYLTIKVSNVKGLCVSSWRFATSLGLWVNAQSHQCGAGQCRGGVWPWLPAGKFWQGGDSNFYGLWVRDGGQRSSGGKRETRHQLLTVLHRDLQQNHDTVYKVPGKRKWRNIHRWVWCERHSNWHSNPTDVGNRSLPRHDTNLHSIVTVHCSSLISGRHDVWAIDGLSFISQGNVQRSGRESSFHALNSRHIDPPKLLHLSNSSPMHGRSVALVAVMNTPTTFCNVNHMQKKEYYHDNWIINEWNKICCNLSYSPRGNVPSGGNGKTRMASRS